MIIHKIGFGGGCHWCTEAYFQSLKGVQRVEQGWISSTAPNETLSEAIVVHYDPLIIPLKTLIEIHLHTHASTSNHSLRYKYRSAVYVFDRNISEAQKLVAECQGDFNEPIITQVLLFHRFKLNSAQYQDYYKRNTENAFCQAYISPKLEMIKKEYGKNFKDIKDNSTDGVKPARRENHE